MKERKANRMKGYDYSKDNLYFVTICVHNRINYFGEIPVGTGRDLSIKTNDLSIKTNDLSDLITNDLSIIKPDEISLENQRDLQNLMILNEYGKIAEKQWYWLAKQYPYIILHAFVVMPNHIHGIIEINRNNVVGTGRDLSISTNDLSISTNDLSISTNDLTKNINDISKNINDLTKNIDDISIGTGRDLSLQESTIKIKSLSELIGAYKTTVSKQIHLLGNNDRSQPVNTFAWQRSFHDHIIRNDESYQKIYNYIINNPQKWVEDKFYNNGK